MTTTVDNETLAVGPREAAKMLGIGFRTLWQLSIEGKIPHRAVSLGPSNRRYRRLYYVELLREWLKRPEAKTPVTLIDWIRSQSDGA